MLRSEEKVRLPHHPEAVDALRTPTADDPWRVLLSGCMAAWPCGVDGHDYGMPRLRPKWLDSPLVALVPFCPEDVGLGTPRPMPDLHGGDGFAVLDGRARVLDPDRNDLTEGMLAGARAMLAVARERRVDLAVLTDASAACGSQVISLGCRFDEPRRHQRGVGVATAMLLRAGVPVVSWRDFHTLARLHRRIDPTVEIPAEARDHHESAWVLEHLPR
jgi:uncharacterized protein YbbK (DUF523 family)